MKIFGREAAILTDTQILVARLTALRAGYLDQLDFALQEAITAIPTTAMRGTDSSLLASNYATERGTNNALLASNYTTERGTDDAALASAWTAALATALENYTSIRAGYIDELGATNIPADIGENDDSHDGATLFGRLQQLIEHVHTRQYVYPTLADGVILTTGAGDWGLGTITEIVPANAITFIFDIYELVIEDVNTQDKTYELILYYGGSDIVCGGTRFAATSNKGGVPNVNMQTVLIPANSRVKAQLAIQDGGNKTAKVSIRYHPY